MTYEIVALAAIALSGLWILRAAKRNTTIAELEVRNGEVRVVRGGIALGILHDLRDVVRSPTVRAARIDITRDSGAASVLVVGDASPAQVQQIRNVVGSVPFAKLVNAPRKA